MGMQGQSPLLWGLGGNAPPKRFSWYNDFTVLVRYLQ